MIRKSACLLALLACTRALAVVPDAGPMIGHVTDNSARIWMQFPIAGDVTINVYDAARGIPVGGVRVGLEGPSPFVCDVPVNGLQPNRTYRIEVKFDGEPVKLPAPEVAIRTTPSPGDEAIFTVAFGGDLAITPLAPVGAATRPAPAPAHKIPVFNAITNLKPRAFLFLGNTGYLPPKLDDFPAMHKPAARFLADFHAAIRKEPDLQELFRTTPIYGIYADRDYGPFTSKDFGPESIVAFHNYWPNPDWGTPAAPGCYCTFNYGDIDFFLLDARTFRTESKPGEDARLLGDAQIAWLEKNLKQARGSFKVLAAPVPLWGDDPAKPDPAAWSNYPAEQKAFLTWLADNRVNGILSLVGGQPLAQLTKADPASTGLRYPLFSLNSSARPQPQPRRCRHPRRILRHPRLRRPGRAPLHHPPHPRHHRQTPPRTNAPFQQPP
ncbi:MAG TPA: alkaline phosphatase D family protein [Phycisphaerae bacterium]|nr:alkaline phosphatase D family protein [Phycisphaerae bacterium]